MTPERWDHVADLLNEALGYPSAERSAFLNQACAGDAALRAEVDDLLAADAEAGATLEASAGQPVARLLAHLETDMGTGALALPAPGTLVGGYEVLREIGHGGMGVVFKARDTRLGRLAALKFLPFYRSVTEQARARFVAEAQAASALDHPNICTIYEIGETEAGQTYIAMAYYAGETLQCTIDRGPLPLNQCLRLAVQIAQGLAAAHRQGIVHRDVKPANVMVTEPPPAAAGGTVKLLDFGLAKWASDALITKSGAVLGTAAYMAPEQARGEPVDGRADLWALGAVLYEMLTAGGRSRATPRPPFSTPFWRRNLSR